jgi:hypothetical protein
LRPLDHLRDVLGSKSIEKEGVGSRATLDHFDTTFVHVPGDQDDHVVTLASPGVVGVDAGVELVIARPAIQPVLTFAGLEPIVALAAVEVVIAPILIGRLIQERVISRTSEKLVGSLGPVEQIITLTTV